MMKSVNELILAERRVTVLNISWQVEISLGAFRKILNEYLAFYQVTCRRVSPWQCNKNSGKYLSIWFRIAEIFFLQSWSRFHWFPFVWSPQRIFAGRKDFLWWWSEDLRDEHFKPFSRLFDQTMPCNFFTCWLSIKRIFYQFMVRCMQLNFFGVGRNRISVVGPISLFLLDSLNWWFC